MKIKTPNLRVRFSNWLRMRRFRKEQWHHWFAWYPVKATFTKYNYESTDYVWLEKVRRKYVRSMYLSPGHTGDWLYKTVDSVRQNALSWTDA